MISQKKNYLLKYMQQLEQQKKIKPEKERVSFNLIPQMLNAISLKNIFILWNKTFDVQI